MMAGRVAAAQDAEGGEVQPPTAAPLSPPPAVTAEVNVRAGPDAPPSVSIAAPVAAGVSPDGQWVFTQQYGWIWMPFGQSYTYAPTVAGGDPYMFVYYPAFGWRWIAAPWVFGIGPRPYFGVWGWHHYGWYGHGWYGHHWWGYREGWPGVTTASW
jgi:hypothetical protein